MKYMVMIQEHADDFAKRNHPEHAEAYWQSWSVYSDFIRKADPDYTGAALQPPETATTISASGIQDGPFADTKEQLGGFFIINVENLDIALDIARQCPATQNGAVEVRPVLPMEG